MQPGAAAQIAAAAAGRSHARPLKSFTEQIRGMENAPRPDCDLDCAGCMWAPEAVQECSISCLRAAVHGIVIIVGQRSCFFGFYDDDDDDDDGVEPKRSLAVRSDEQLPHLERSLFNRKKKRTMGVLLDSDN